MSGFTCPVQDCEKELSRLQVMHFRSAHDCDPIEWVEEQYGSEIREKYAAKSGSYTIADEYEWLSSDMVCGIVETRTHYQAIAGDNNPMKRDEIAAQFTGDDNPAKRPGVRKKLREASTGRTLSDAAKEKIAQKNRGNKVGEEHRQKIAAGASKRDTSYMQTEAYSRALSEGLKGREPTYPTPYEVDELTHRVRSSWEEEIAKLLVENEIAYAYEEEFQLSIGSYYPDFVGDSFVIEVKGFSNERSVEKATYFMKEFPSYTYVVVGDEIPFDVHIPWERREEILEVLSNG
jgi:hypothetical protein